MLDINLFRNDMARVAAGLAQRGAVVDVARFEALEARRKETFKRALERTETLYGSFDDGQREWLARELATSPFDADLWFAERLARQRELLQTLRRLRAERAGAAQMQAALRTQYDQAWRSPREAYRNYQQRLRQFNCSLAARVHNQTTPAQRQAAAATLKGWETDLRVLAAEPRPAISPDRL